jgi:uncharacterized membrane protein (UPF0127 family)
MTVRVDHAVLHAEIANHPAARARGLMHRAKLAEDRGMLFVWPTAQQLTFWMKDTEIDLDVGFFDAQRRLLNVATMEAHDSATRHRSEGPARYALETNAGWFASNGLGPGARLSLPQSVTAR